jgi:hypothetical protein
MNKLTEEIKEIETETIAYDLESEGYFDPPRCQAF